MLVRAQLQNNNILNVQYMDSEDIFHFLATYYPPDKDMDCHRLVCDEGIVWIDPQKHGALISRFEKEGKGIIVAKKSTTPPYNLEALDIRAYSS